ENSRRERDRVAVLRLVIVKKPNTLRCPIGMINRGPAARAGKAAQNKDKQKNARHLHNCGTSILAIRRPPSYLNESAWQGNFSYRAIYFASTLPQMLWPEQPESLPGTKPGHSFAAKSSSSNACRGSSLSRSFYQFVGIRRNAEMPSTLSRLFRAQQARWPWRFACPRCIAPKRRARG